MYDEVRFGREFFDMLVAVDARIAGEVAASGCCACGGRLHRGDYVRKPRGALLAAAGEEFVVRFSLCCEREGCRRRATPPSLRFLGRRVYVGAAVVVASVVALALRRLSAARRQTGVPARTLGRWLGWWRGSFTATAAFVAIASRLVPAIDQSTIPASILERLDGDALARVRRLLEQIAPLTTASVPDGSRFVREAISPS
ncbi:MAG TPA: hypothetical protein VGM45_12015 [Gaiellaceae bacterium]|jgi:hypothetical protein